MQCINKSLIGLNVLKFNPIKKFYGSLKPTELHLGVTLFQTRGEEDKSTIVHFTNSRQYNGEC